MNVGFIGCGNISYFHADVLKYLNVNILAASDVHEEKLQKFKKKYDIPFGYFSWEKMLENHDLDAIWVTASWYIVDQILLDILKYNRPIFFEKPVALSVEKIEDSIKKYKHMIDKVQIGYNRRFYDFIPQIKDLIQEIDINAVEIHIPESTSRINDQCLLQNLFLQNSSHVIDLLYFLMGEVEIKIKEDFSEIKINNRSLKGYNNLLVAKETIPIHLVANWNSPSNFSIKFHSNELLIELLPIEVATIYNGFDIIEPTKENPIRLYKPKIKKRFFITSESSRFKPGFLGQTTNFINTCVLNKYKNQQASNLESALIITKICKEIMRAN